MPTFKKVSVDIVTPSGRLSALHQESSRTDSLCESYIQSKTDCSFWISITPELDLVPQKVPETSKVRSHSPPSSHRKYNLHAPVIDLTQDDEREDVGESVNKAKEEEWHLLAEVFLDDLPIAETTCIVYLPWNGRVKERTIKGRIVTDATGRFVERFWYFKEVGLENFLQILTIDKKDADGDLDATEPGEPSGKVSDDMLVDSMNRLGTSGKEKQLETGQAGQIRIVLHKITITGLFIDLDYAPAVSDKYDRGKTSKSTGEASHTAGVGRSVNIKFSDTRKIYHLEESKPYATFLFNYRGEKELRRMKILGAPEPRKRLDKLVPFLTPLAISADYKPKKPTEKSKERPCRSRSASSSEDDAQESQEIVSGSDRAVKGSPQQILSESESDSEAVVVRYSRSRSESSDQEDRYSSALTIVNKPILLALEDVKHEKDANADATTVVSAAGNATLLLEESPRVPEESDGPASSPTNGHDIGTEPLRITEHGEKADQEATSMDELSMRLALVKLKRSHSGEDDEVSGGSGEEGEGELVIQGQRQTKRVRRHKPDPALVQEEVMSEAKEGEATTEEKVSEITSEAKEGEVIPNVKEDEIVPGAKESEIISEAKEVEEL